MDYKLSENNFIKETTKKNKIIIGNTFSYDMNHFIGWLKRFNGSYKKTAHYTIKRDGTIIEHFSPKYYSKYFNNDKLNKNSIIILLENIGWLTESNINDEFIDYVGNIYKYDDIVTKKWRGFKYWSTYSKEQESSLIELIKTLCDTYKIQLNVVSHNTNIPDAVKGEGIYYRSNFDKYFTDVNPTWDFEGFKNKIELN